MGDNDKRFSSKREGHVEAKPLPSERANPLLFDEATGRALSRRERRAMGWRGKTPPGLSAARTRSQRRRDA